VASKRAFATPAGNSKPEPDVFPIDFADIFPTHRFIETYSAPQAGDASNAILRSKPPNSHRVRCPSANSGACATPAVAMRYWRMTRRQTSISLSTRYTIGKGIVSRAPGVACHTTCCEKISPHRSLDGVCPKRSRTEQPSPGMRQTIAVDCGPIISERSIWPVYSSRGGRCAGRSRIQLGHER
jgi:hypothetical protein